MKKLILFTICLLIVQLSFCQTSYPKKQIQQGDTVVVITPGQLAIVNKAIQQKENYELIVPQYEHLLVHQDSLIQVLNLKVADWEQINKANQSIILNFEMQEKEVLRQKKRNCWVVGGISIGVGFIVGALVFGLR